MLNPAGLRKNLGKFFLSDGNDFAVVVNDERSGTCRSLIKSKDVVRHGRSGELRVSQLPSLGTRGYVVRRIHTLGRSHDGVGLLEGATNRQIVREPAE